MANQLTGVLVADFSSFQQAVSESVIKLRSFDEGASKVGASLNRMADQFSGRKIITDATQMAEIFERAGGAAGFTEKELARMAATGTEAVAKLKALGQEVPPGIQKIADETKKVDAEQNKLLGSLKSVAVAFGLAFSVQALTSMIMKVIDLGGELTDLSARTGIGTTALQQFKFAGEQVGVSLDKIVTAVGQMQNRLASGDKSALAALDALGIKFEDLRKMSPEDQFKTIAAALGEVEDQADFVATGMDLMGKGFLEVAPLIKADLQALIDRSRELGVILDEQTVKNLDDMGDSLSQLESVGTAVMASFLKPMLPLLGELAKGLLSAAGWLTKTQIAFEQFVSIVAGKIATIGEFQIKILQLTNAFGINNGVIATFTDLVAQAREISTQLATDATPRLTAAVDKSTGATLRFNAAAAEANVKLGSLNTFVRQAKTGVDFIEPALGNLDAWVKKNATSTEVRNTKLRFTSEVIGELAPELDQVAESIEKVTEAQTRQTASKNAPGSVGVNLEGVTFGNLPSAFNAYNARFGTSSAAGMIGGGPPPDFLSWAMSMGLATRPGTTAPAIQNNFNIVDTESEIARRVSEEIARQLRSGTLVPA